MITREDIKKAANDWESPVLLTELAEKLLAERDNLIDEIRGCGNHLSNGFESANRELQKQLARAFKERDAYRQVAIDWAVSETETSNNTKDKIVKRIDKEVQEILKQNT